MRAEMRQLIAEDAKTQQSREHLETELAQVQSSLLANKAEKKDSERQKKSQEALEVRKPLRPLPHAPLDARARRPGVLSEAPARGASELPRLCTDS